MKIQSGILLVVLGMATVAFAQDATSDLLLAGRKLIAEQKYDEAFKTFEKASKANGQKCSRCFYYMSRTKLLLSDEGGAKKFAKKAIEVAQSPQEQADANAIMGETLLAFAGDSKKQAAEAEEAFRTAQKASPLPVLYLRIGSCLVREDKLDEAKKQFQAYLDTNPGPKDAAVVRRWVENPARARYPAAPDFEFTSLKGEKISLASLEGKVVLLDFWGTWCPPCRESVPELKDIVKKYPPDKLVVISVSSDTEEQKWEQFVADHKMDWIQYRDSDHRIQSDYQVHSFPTYVVIDKDGAIRDRISGLNPQLSLRGRIEDVLKKMM